ncbi:MAG: hypothetical protein KDC98_04955, partial [Planctomycetes bacterium]|nr:hypothetical protein [Planctomycetota bacterium]
MRIAANPLASSLPGAAVLVCLMVLPAAPLSAQSADGGGDGRDVVVSPQFSARAERRAAFREPKVTEAIAGGTAWLLGHQDASGCWDCDGFMANDPPGLGCTGAGNPGQDIGVTGLALLALLAQADRVHRDAVRQAADWLVHEQDAASGRF